MLFNSYEFLIFFPIVVLIYYVIPDRIKYIWLLVSSYYFYMSWNAEYAVLILFSTAVTYAGGLLIGRITETEWETRRKIRAKKTATAACIILNLAVLFYFKYFGFAYSIAGSLLGLLNIRVIVPEFDIVLPVGISFYTFQALGYTIDVYRGEIPAEKNFLRYALFVSFFPQLVAGPIERTGNLLHQLSTPHRFDWDQAKDGFLLMLWGFFLKIVLADRIALFVDTVYGDYASYEGWYLILATVLFAFQIYCDFYGYSVIAMGAAEILGVRLMENFRAPYLSSTVTDFWRNWHISLTTWFRDYLYIPLGGNRKGKVRKYVNKIIVFSASGLWHGASLSYVAWGMLNGIYQVIGEILMPIRVRLNRFLGLRRESLGYRLFGCIITFVLVDFTWVFFRSDSLSDALRIIRSIVTVNNIWILFDGSVFNCGLDQPNWTVMIICLCILLFADRMKHKGIAVRKVIAAQDWLVQCLIVSLVISGILLFGIWGPGYSESNFIYFQF